MTIKYSLAVPAVYMVFVMLWLGAFITQAGHGANPFEFVLNLVYPVRFMFDHLPTIKTENTFLVFGIFVLAGLTQWTLTGWVLDKVLAHIKKKRVKR